MRVLSLAGCWRVHDTARIFAFETWLMPESLLCAVVFEGTISAKAENSIHLGGRGASRCAHCDLHKLLMAGAGSSWCICPCVR